VRAETGYFLPLPVAEDTKASTKSEPLVVAVVVKIIIIIIVTIPCTALHYHCTTITSMIFVVSIILITVLVKKIDWDQCIKKNDHQNVDSLGGGNGPLLLLFPPASRNDGTVVTSRTLIDDHD
jgi:hypothetical protein